MDEKKLKYTKKYMSEYKKLTQDMEVVDQKKLVDVYNYVVKLGIDGEKNVQENAQLQVSAEKASVAEGFIRLFVATCGLTAMNGCMIGGLVSGNQDWYNFGKAIGGFLCTYTGLDIGFNIMSKHGFISYMQHKLLKESSDKLKELSNFCDYIADDLAKHNIYITEDGIDYTEEIAEGETGEEILARFEIDEIINVDENGDVIGVDVVDNNQDEMDK